LCEKREWRIPKTSFGTRHPVTFPAQNIGNDGSKLDFPNLLVVTTFSVQILREHFLNLCHVQNPVLENSFSEFTETDDGSAGRNDQSAASVLVGDRRQKGIAQLDARFFRPLFVRKFTAQAGISQLLLQTLLDNDRFRKRRKAR
jgi:hypothetical protein